MYVSTISCIYYVYDFFKKIMIRKYRNSMKPEFLADLFFIDGRRGEKYKANMIRVALKTL